MAALSSAPVGQQFFFARVFQIKTGKALYAMTKPISVNEKVALVYETAMEPFETMVRAGLQWYDEEPIEKDAGLNDVSVAITSWYPITEDIPKFKNENERVKEAIIQLRTSHSPESLIVLQLIRLISRTIKQFFPNLDFKKSNFLIDTPTASYLASESIFHSTSGSIDVEITYLTSPSEEHKGPD